MNTNSLAPDQEFDRPQARVAGAAGEPQRAVQQPVPDRGVEPEPGRSRPASGGGAAHCSPAPTGAALRPRRPRRSAPRCGARPPTAAPRTTRPRPKPCRASDLHRSQASVSSRRCADPHPATAAPAHRLCHHRTASELPAPRRGVVSPAVPGSTWHPRPDRQGAGPRLVPEQVEHLGRRTDEGDPRPGAPPRQLGRLASEPVPRVQVPAAPPGAPRSPAPPRRDSRRAPAARTRPREEVRVVARLVHSDRAQPELGGGAQHLTAISPLVGDEVRRQTP